MKQITQGLPSKARSRALCHREVPVSHSYPGVGRASGGLSFVYVEIDPVVVPVITIVRAIIITQDSVASVGLNFRSLTPPQLIYLLIHFTSQSLALFPVYQSQSVSFLNFSPLLL